jgi:hypothetical protein
VVEDARWQFTEGSAHFQGKRWSEALSAFERSFALVPSPNTELLIARCQRELGRRPEAVRSFEHAAEEARRRTAAGETKYAQTAEVAAAEGAQLRAQLGTIRVHVARATSATVTIEGRAVQLDPNGDATVLRDPGTTTIVVRDANGAQQKQTVTVLAGVTVQTDFAGSDGSPPPPPPPPPGGDTGGGTSWAVPAAVGAGVVTVAGFAVFTGFGLASKATYDDLAARCGPTNCGPADRDDADRGKRQQTIANVGLVVGSVAAVATIAFVVVAFTSGPKNASARGLTPWSIRF